MLLRDAGRLAGIPGVLIHGRLDLSGPLDTRVGARPGLAGRRSWSWSATPATRAATRCATEVLGALDDFSR